MDDTLYTWYVLPFLIFLARICDVSLGTVRVVFISRGYRYLAAIIGFFEIIVWLSAMRQIMLQIGNPVCFFAYAFGFSFGTYVGIWIAERLSLGNVVIRVVTQKDATALRKALREERIGATHVDGLGSEGPVSIIFMVLPSKKLNKVIDLVHTHNPMAFYTIEDVQRVNEGVFPEVAPMGKSTLIEMFKPLRKGK